RGSALPLAIAAACLRDVAAALFAAGNADSRAAAGCANEGAIRTVRPLSGGVAGLRREARALLRTRYAGARALTGRTDERADLVVHPLRLLIANLLGFAVAAGRPGSADAGTRLVDTNEGTRGTHPLPAHAARLQHVGDALLRSRRAHAPAAP